MAINQRQIASTLNLSVATISRSLKNDQAIHPRTRALVLETARQMGYEFPSQQNKSNGDKEEMKPFCTMIQTDSVPYSTGSGELGESMTGISEGAFRNKTSMITHYVPLRHREFAADQEFLPKALVSGMAEGIILVHYYPDEVVKKFSNMFPCVSISYDYRLPYMDIVSENNINGIIELLKHLFDHGHRRVAFVGEDVNIYYPHRNRLSGFNSGILELGLEYKPEHIYNFNRKETVDEIIKAVGNKDFTALVCASDEIGFEVMKALKKSGHKVPEDLSLVGFKGIAPPEGLPRMTSMRIPSEQIGITAVSMLKERIANPSCPARRMYLDTIFVDGDTVHTIDKR